MLFITKLSPVEIQNLESMYQCHASHTLRTRAHAILLSNNGFKLSKIAEIIGICRQTASTWLHKWKADGITGLFDLPRNGRPYILSKEAEVKVLAHVEESPRSLRKVLADLASSLGVKISNSTLKRLCKTHDLVWKRVKKSLKSKRNPVLFEKSRQQLAELIIQEKQGIIDLFYFDESGFTLDPCVPYAWQPKNRNIEIPAAKSKRLNVLGFINRKCSFTSLVFESSVTSAVVVACINHFVSTLQRPTSLVIDNASIHTSQEFLDNIDFWKENLLTIVPISPYSPELNIIEILWRKIKYEWMPFEAYESFENLERCLMDVLANIGKSYTIDFS